MKKSIQLILLLLLPVLLLAQSPPCDCCTDECDCCPAGFWPNPTPSCFAENVSPPCGSLTPLDPTPELENTIHARLAADNGGSWTCVDPANNDPVYSYEGNDCFGGIERHLSRTVMMDYLWSKSKFRQSHFAEDRDAYFSYIYDLIKLKATYINLAGHKYGGLEQWNYCCSEGDYHYIRQLVVDINTAFDCAGLTRPVIQGTIYEYIDLDDGLTIRKIAVPISPMIIAEFIPFMNSTEKEHYLLPDGTPKSNLAFSQDRIVMDQSIPATAEDEIRTPDIMKIECQMFFYHIARMYIDAGYTSLAMGQISHYGAGDLVDGNFDIMYRVVELIRNYAKNKTTPPNFVLLTAEPQPGFDLTYTDGDGKKHYLFDHESRPLRPREITSSPVHDDPEIVLPCGGYDPIDQALWMPGGPCGNDPDDQALDAVLDICHLLNFETQFPQNAIAPTGCQFERLPYVVYFDYAGLCNPNADHPQEGDIRTYGFSDANWLIELSDECQTAWLSSVFCRLREITNGMGFLQLPGRVNLPNQHPLPCDPPCDPCHMPPNDQPNLPSIYDEDFFGEFYAMNAHPGLMDAVIAQMTTGQPAITFSEECVYVGCRRTCGDNIPAPTGSIYRVEQKVYNFCVTNPDCTSQYTWHIRKSTGEWLPFERGLCFRFIPPSPGTYIIGLRQDNPRLPGGVAIVPADVTVNITEAQCCQLVPVNICNEAFEFTSSCRSVANGYNEYKFSIQFPPGVTQPTSVYLYPNKGIVEDFVFTQADGRADGLYKLPSDDPNQRIEINMRLIHFQSTSQYVDILLLKDLPACARNLQPFSKTDGTDSGTDLPDIKALSSINLESDVLYKYQVFDMAGKMLVEGHMVSNDKLDLISLPAGLYLCKIYNEDLTLLTTYKFFHSKE